ncbi:hypothetical protein [Streptacidiphilus sp. EB129]|uniref:hypothetical protein n=1 Tax=Streptacidiphilus sp. EB129 TaxID=3156262 RepID=UPI0035178CC3
MNGLWIAVATVAVAVALVVLVHVRVRDHEQRREEDEARARAVVVVWSLHSGQLPHAPGAVITNGGGDPVRAVEITCVVALDGQGREWVAVLPGGPPYRGELGAGDAWSCALSGPYLRHGEPRTVVDGDQLVVTFRFTDLHGHQWQRVGDDPPQLLYAGSSHPRRHSA